MTIECDLPGRYVLQAVERWSDPDIQLEACPDQDLLIATMTISGSDQARAAELAILELQQKVKAVATHTFMTWHDCQCQELARVHQLRQVA